MRGHNQAVLMALQYDLYLISKLRKDVALFERYDGKYSGKGKPRKYGGRVRVELMRAKYLQKSERIGDVAGELLSRDISAQRVCNAARVWW